MTMELTMLGTGSALVTECYNTCFVIRDGGRYFMVDGGGGNTVLRQLRRADLNWMDMRDIFVTHKHMDHVIGVLWMARMICQSMKRGDYVGDANIYGHEKVLRLIRDMAGEMLPHKTARFLGDRLHLIPIHDGDTHTIIGRDVTFFDIGSTKTKQFGFCMQLDGGERLTCCGDEPYRPCEETYARGSKWLLHEAFCLHAQADVFEPYEKHHSTVRDACELAEGLGVRNLLLYHTEDRNLAQRKALYTAEGSRYFSGNLYVPDDLETIEL